MEWIVGVGFRGSGLDVMEVFPRPLWGTCCTKHGRTLTLCGDDSTCCEGLVVVFSCVFHQRRDGYSGGECGYTTRVDVDNAA